MPRVALRLAPLLVLAACSGETTPQTPDTGASETRDSGAVETPDAGVEVPDAGPSDTGVLDCSRNPFRCAPMQLMDEQCLCLDECEGDLRWNAVTQECEMPPQGECLADRDCRQGEVCLDTPSSGGLGECTGQATCRCLRTCDPWVGIAQSGCPPDFDFGGGRVPVTCTWLGDPALPDALCLPQGSGGAQGDPCSEVSACNRNQNLFCFGATSNAPIGACARYCDDARPDNTVCEGLGGYTCVGLGNPMFPDLGYCGNAPPTDLGTTCTSSVTCEGALCSTVLSGSCSLACGGLSMCGLDGLCVSFTGGAPAGEEDICMARCAGPDATGDAECTAKNPNTICRALIPNAPALCAPPCTRGIGCAPGTTCDPASGRCS